MIRQTWLPTRPFAEKDYNERKKKRKKTPTHTKKTDGATSTCPSFRYRCNHRITELVVCAKFHISKLSKNRVTAYPTEFNQEEYKIYETT